MCKIHGLVFIGLVAFAFQCGCCCTQKCDGDNGNGGSPTPKFKYEQEPGTPAIGDDVSITVSSTVDVEEWVVPTLPERWSSVSKKRTLNLEGPVPSGTADHAAPELQVKAILASGKDRVIDINVHGRSRVVNWNTHRVERSVTTEKALDYYSMDMGIRPVTWPGEPFRFNVHFDTRDLRPDDTIQLLDFDDQKSWIGPEQIIDHEQTRFNDQGADPAEHFTVSPSYDSLKDGEFLVKVTVNKDWMDDYDVATKIRIIVR